METTFTKTIVKNITYLKNTTDRVHNWYTKDQIIQPGTELDLRMVKYPDGRIDFTVFKELNGEFYTNTSMQDPDGNVTLNFGGLNASRELKNHFKIKSNEI